jgi:hypothetical protein
MRLLYNPCTSHSTQTTDRHFPVQPCVCRFRTADAMHLEDPTSTRRGKSLAPLTYRTGQRHALGAGLPISVANPGQTPASVLHLWQALRSESSTR